MYCVLYLLCKMLCIVYKNGYFYYTPYMQRVMHTYL